MSAGQEQPSERAKDGPHMIVVGIDGSDSSMRAAAYAAGLARRQRAELVLIYVQQLPANPAAAAVAIETGQRTAELLETEIRGFTRDMGEGSAVKWRFHTVRGDPFRCLVDSADRLKADAVVVGASTGLGHKVVGSIAIRLVKTGRWPVTVVP